MNPKISLLSLVTKSSFEGQNFVGRFSRIHCSKIGIASYIGSNCKIISTSIGRFCSIGSGVRIVFGAHPTKKFVSTHPVFYSIKNPTNFQWVNHNRFNEYKYVDERKKFFVKIENDVWIGDNVLIMQGVTIHNGAIVGAGSVVTHDVDPYAIVAGVPAKIIKFRFTPDQITALLKISWWNKSLEWIKKNCNIFSDIESFINTSNT